MPDPEQDPSCATCMYFDPVGDGHGRCRRKPPTIAENILLRTIWDADVPPTQGIQLASVFPVTDARDWCGEHFDLDDITGGGGGENVIPMRPAA